MKEKTYECLLRNKFIAIDAKSIDDFISIYENMLDVMKRWKEKGIIYQHGAEDDYATFITHDETIAKEEGFDDRSDLYGEDYDEENMDLIFNNENEILSSNLSGFLLNDAKSCSYTKYSPFPIPKV